MKRNPLSPPSADDWAAAGDEKAGRRLLHRAGTVLCALFCIGVMLASVAAVAVALYIAHLTNNDTDALDLYALELAENSIVYAREPDTGEWVEYATFSGDSDRVWASMDQFPQTLRDAVVSVEDRNFWQQDFGINPARILGAALNELTGQRLYGNRQGASTLEQQLVQNLTGDPAQTIPGKFTEICRAIVMASTYSKETILEAYLNIAPLTGTISGMQIGAQQYFGKDVSQITLAEAATLASIPRSPVAYNPYTNPENLLERRNWVLQLMLEQERISEGEYAAAAAAPLGVLPRGSAEQSSAVSAINSYFTDALFNQLVRDIMEEEGCERQEALRIVRTGGLRIYATVNPFMQNTLESMMEDDGEDGYFPAHWREEAVDTGIPYEDAAGIAYDEAGLPLNARGEPVFGADEEPVYEQAGTLRTGQSAQPNANGVYTLVFYRRVRTQAAMVTLDYEGHVLAAVGGVGEKQYDLSLNRATDVPRQTGSTMKPIGAYALGIEYGLINYSTALYDSPLYTAQDKRILDTELCRRLGLSLDPNAPANLARDDIWRDWPTNYSGPGSGEPVLVADALARSLNTIAVRVGEMVEAQRIFNFVQDSLRISTLDPTNDAALGPIVLGSQTQGITPLELANAYSIFYDGIYNPPVYYTQVMTTDGSVYLDSAVGTYFEQAISPQTTTIMNRLLRNVLFAANGTSYGMAPDGEMDAVAKTGITSDYRDFTFAGLTPYYVTAGWWGYDSPADMSQQGVRSGRPLQRLWGDYMETVQADLPYREFPMAEGVVTRRFDPATGLLVSSGGRIGYYTEDNLPDELETALP